MPQYAKGLRFLPTSSLAGRRFVEAKGSRVASDPADPAIREHNAAIEKKRQEKLAAKKARRAAKS